VGEQSNPKDAQRLPVTPKKWIRKFFHFPAFSIFISIREMRERERERELDRVVKKSLRHLW